MLLSFPCWFPSFNVLWQKGRRFSLALITTNTHTQTNSRLATPVALLRLVTRNRKKYYCRKQCEDIITKQGRQAQVFISVHCRLHVAYNTNIKVGDKVTEQNLAISRYRKSRVLRYNNSKLSTISLPFVLQVPRIGPSGSFRFRIAYEAVIFIGLWGRESACRKACTHTERAPNGIRSRYSSVRAVPDSSYARPLWWNFMILFEAMSQNTSHVFVKKKDRVRELQTGPLQDKRSF
jgi:hypothetical protein